MLFRFAAHCGIPAKRVFCAAVLMAAASILFTGCLTEKDSKETTAEDTHLVLGTVARIQARGTEKATCFRI